jgi:hypothetical protein
MSVLCLPGLSSFLAGLAATFARGSRHARRSDQLWRVLRHQAEIIRLPCVRAEDAERVCDLAIGNAMGITMLDDIIDVDGDLPRFDALAWLYEETMFGERPSPLTVDAADETALAVIALARGLRAGLDALPRAAELRELLRFDLARIIVAMRYHALFVRYRMTSEGEYLGDHHAHSITVVWMKTMDLCASPGFALAELGALRDAARLAQRAFVHCADATTWITEVSAGEPFPGVVKQAIVRGQLDWDEASALATDPAALTAHIRRCGVLEAIAADIAADLRALVDACARVRSVDLLGWPAQVEELLRVQRLMVGTV